jgi:hypothetical protein
MDPEDITPEDSLTPVFLDTTPIVPSNNPDPIEEMEAQKAIELAAGEAALAELRAAYPGLSETTLCRMANMPLVSGN